MLLTLIAAPAAWADPSPAKSGGADPATKTLPAKASDTAKANAFGQQGAAAKAAHQPDAKPADAKPADAKPADPSSGGADPATKTLPAKASDTAKANAFGQQGAAAKAAHQSAKAAAAQEAQRAATQGPPASSARPSASATAHASASGVSHGFDRAAAGSTNGQGSAPSTTPGDTHSHR